MCKRTPIHASGHMHRKIYIRTVRGKTSERLEEKALAWPWVRVQGRSVVNLIAKV